MIGDKKAAQASRILLDPNAVESLRKLEIKLGVQIKFIHETRNPYDNIATMTLRRINAEKKGQESLKVSCYQPILLLAGARHSCKKNRPISILKFSLRQYTSERGSREELHGLSGSFHRAASCQKSTVFGWTLLYRKWDILKILNHRNWPEVITYVYKLRNNFS